MAAPRSSNVLRASSRSCCALSFKWPTRPTNPCCWWPFPEGGFCGVLAMVGGSSPRGDPPDDEPRGQGDGQRGDWALLDEAADFLIQRVQLAAGLLHLGAGPVLDLACLVGQRVGGSHR